MFKEVMKFFKDDNTKWFFVIAIVLLIIWSLMSYSDSKGKVVDSMYSSTTAVQPHNAGELKGQEESAQLNNYKQPVIQQVPSANSGSNGSGYALQPVANPQDLLPKDKNSEWAKLNPVNSDQPILPSLLSAGNLIGLDTVGQTLKNANLQLRSDPIIQKMNVGPWNNSTYEADLGRVPMEIGCGVPN